MSARIGITNFGRVGRAYLRIVLAPEPHDIEVVAINDVSDSAMLARLLRFDSTFGPLHREVEDLGDVIVVDGHKIAVSAIREPDQLPWREQGVQVVDATIVMGVDDETYDPARHHLISNASCTTNSVAPMVELLHDNFGFAQGYMSTVHAYTNDQNVLDAPPKDPRRARAAAVNIITTTTGAARVVGEVLPAIKRRLDGVALRVALNLGWRTHEVAILPLAAGAAAGSVGLTTVPLSAGRYELVCNLPNHYADGMYQELVVT